MKTEKLIVLLGVIFLISGFCTADDLSVSWNYTIPHSGNIMVSSLKIADFNNNGGFDIAVGAYDDQRTISETDNSAGWVYLLNTDGTLKWEQDTPGAISGMIAADLYGDGKKEIITGVSSRIYILNGNGDNKQVSLGDTSYKAVSIAVEDLNNDGNKEMIIAGGSAEKGKIFIFNKNLALIKQTDLLGSPSSMLISDINGDGQKEILVGIADTTNTDMPAYVQAFDSKGNKLWTSDKTKNGVLSLAALDMNGNGSQEILAGSIGSLYVLSSKGETISINENITKADEEINIIKVSDLMNNDSLPEVILGCPDTVYMLDRTLNRIWKNSIYGLFDIETEDIDGDRLKEIAVASDKLYIFDKDGNLVDDFDAKTGRFSVRSICIGDINEDTYPEILIGTSNGEVYALSSTSQSNRIKANFQYRRAQTQFAAGNYAEAETSAQNAKKIYLELGDNSMAQNVTDYLKKVMTQEAKVSNQSADAQTYLDNAYTALNESDYVKAINNSRIAKAKYMNINPQDPQQIQRADDIINTSIDYLRFTADNDLENATAYAGSKDYEKAMQYAKNASEAYAYLSDNADYARSQAIVNASEQALGITGETNEGQQPAGIDLSSMMPILIAVALIVVIAFIAVYALKNRKKKTKKDEPEDSVLDEMEKERPKEKKKEVREQRSIKQEEQKHWIREVDEAMKEPRKEDRAAVENRETPAVHKHRKTMKRITKDSYRGEGISLRNLSCSPSEDDIRD